MKIIGRCMAGILFITVISISFTQGSSVRVGVMPFTGGGSKGGVSPKSDEVVAGLISAMGKYKFISLVEQTEISKIMEEISKGQSGIVDDATAVQAGKIHGIQVMIVGTVSGSTVSGRAVHAETGKVITAGTSSLTSLDSLGTALASGIESYLARETLKSLKNDSPAINFDFWVEKSNNQKIAAGASGKMAIGNKIAFKFKSDSDGYCTIVDIQPGGDVVVIFPNDSQPDNKVQAGKVYTVPSEEDGFEITVTEPAGIDTVVAFFTKKKVDWLDRNKLEGDGFWSVKQGEKLSLSRGITVTAIKLKATDWETKALNIDVVK